MTMFTRLAQEMFIDVTAGEIYAVWHPILRFVHKDIRDTG